MAVSFTWNDTDITSRVLWESISINAVLTKERGTATFTILTPVTTADPLANIPAQMDVIEITDSSGIFFGGNVTEVENTINGQNGGLVVSSVITVTDYGFLLDSKLVKTSFSNEDPQDIVQSLIAQFAPPGFTTNHVQRGNFLVASISFNYEQLTDCLESIAQQIGWDWYVDQDQDIHFFFATTADGSSEYNPAPFNIEDDTINPDTGEGYLDWTTLDIDQNITNLKNQVYVIGGTYAKNFTKAAVPNQNPPEYTPVDVYKTDGTTSVFPLAFHYESSTIEADLSGTPISIGIYTQEDPTAYDAMYNDAGPNLIFYYESNNPTPPDSGLTLTIQGIAQVPIVAIVNDPTSIASFVNEETGFDGIFEDSIIDSSITSVQEAQERGLADITLFGHPVYDVKFNTRVPGLRIGQIIMLNSVKFGVSSYPLVIRTITATGFTQAEMIYAIEAIGSQVVTFTDTMLLLLQQQNAATPVATSTVIQIITKSPDETITTSDATTVTGTSRTTPFVWGGGSSPTPMKWGFACWT